MADALGRLPDEDEQYEAYRTAVEAIRGIAREEHTRAFLAS